METLEAARLKVEYYGEEALTFFDSGKDVLTGYTCGIRLPSNDFRGLKVSEFDPTGECSIESYGWTHVNFNFEMTSYGLDEIKSLTDKGYTLEEIQGRTAGEIGITAIMGVVQPLFKIPRSLNDKLKKDQALDEILKRTKELLPYIYTTIDLQGSRATDLRSSQGTLPRDQFTDSIDYSDNEWMCLQELFDNLYGQAINTLFYVDENTLEKKS